NCSLNINECAGNPCKNGATCLDGIASYQCACTPAFTGIDCTIPINHCLSSPCRNGGICSSPIGAVTYKCTCPSPYSGRICQDQCRSPPCEFTYLTTGPFKSASEYLVMPWQSNGTDGMILLGGACKL